MYKHASYDYSAADVGHDELTFCVPRPRCNTDRPHDPSHCGDSAGNGIRNEYLRAATAYRGGLGLGGQVTGVVHSSSIGFQGYGRLNSTLTFSKRLVSDW